MAKIPVAKIPVDREDFERSDLADAVRHMPHLSRDVPLIARIREVVETKTYPAGFRLLCMNCNFAIGHFGSCPHQLLARKVA